MTYVVYRRFRGRGIGGAFNLRFGTRVEEKNGWLFAEDGRCICAATSENGWEHFRQDTAEGAERQKMLEELYAYYVRHDFDITSSAENQYWKNILRTMPTKALREKWREKCIGSAEK